MSLTARHNASKSNPSLNENSLLPNNAPRNDPKYNKNKGKKKNNLVILVGGLFLLCACYVLLSGALDERSLGHHPKSSYLASNVRKAVSNAAEGKVGTHRSLDGNKVKAGKLHLHKAKAIENPYMGWQPVIDPNQDTDEKCDSWRTCFTKNDCPAKCRDSRKDFGKAPPRPGFVPDPDATEEENNTNAQKVDWVPDVTVLRRMLEAGVDEHGDAWPPTLVTGDNRELCEKIGNFGGTNDENAVLLNAVPIRGMPLLGDGIDISKKKMKRAPRILCMVYTMEENHHTNIRVIRETWGPGCDGFLAFSTRDDPRIPAISLAHDGAEEYSNMWQKVRSIWKFVGTHYLEDFDFFFQGGEDLYVLPQNMRNYLADAIEDPTEEDFFGGRRFQFGGNDFFNSGGAGYALSQATLRKYVTTGLDHPECFAQKHSSMEDVFIAKCLKKAFGIDVVDTRDDQDRERFHPFAPAAHYNWRPPVPPATDWYERYNRLWPPKLKEQCCAPDSVSFHYMKKPAMVRHLHALLYFCD